MTLQVGTRWDEDLAMARPIRIRYRFAGREGDRYWWYCTIPGDSRVHRLSCSVDWFWRT